MTKKEKKEIWKRECSLVHHNKYDYQLVIYKTLKTYVSIICPIHGEFEQRMDHHKSGSGCSKCAGNDIDKKDIVKRFNIKHNYRYDYSETVFKTAKDKIIYICPVHGEIPQYISNHYKYGCFKCDKSKKSNTKEFIKKSNIKHKFEFDYSPTIYIDAKTIVKINCLLHGEFEQTPNNHLSGQGCPDCANIKRRLKRIKQIEKDKFDGNQMIPSYNIKACELFDKLSEENNIYIQHAMNGGEFHIKELGYWVDGYDEENNTVYEFDEKHHKYQKEKDLIREKEIIKYLGCVFIRL